MHPQLDKPLSFAPKRTNLRKNFFIFSSILLLACLALHLCISLFGFRDFADGYDYHGCANAFITQNKFPTVIPYEQLAQIESPDITTSTVNYPNYGFQLAIGIVSLLRDERDFLNGVIVSSIFTVMFAYISYFCALFVTKKQSFSISFVVLLLFHPSILNILARPLADMGLLFFFAAAVFTSQLNRPILTGVLLGLGYFYREHSIMFLPFIPLLLPSCISIRKYFSILMQMIIGLVPFLALKNIVEAIYTPETEGFYFRAYSQWFTEWFNWDSMIQFLKNIYSYARSFGKPICILLILSAFFWKKLSLSLLKYIFVGSCIALIPCFMWSARTYVPERYQVYSIFLFYLAILTFISQINTKKLQLAGLCVVIIASFFMHTFLKLDVSRAGELFNPVSSRIFYDKTRAFVSINDRLPENSVILTNDYACAFLAFESPKVVGMSNYDNFLVGGHNSKLDAVLIYNRHRHNFPTEDYIRDNSGTTFKLDTRMTVNEQVDLLLYLREK